MSLVMASPPPPSPSGRRFERQFRAIERAMPALKRPLEVLRQKRWRFVRVPVAILFMIGGVLAILPLFGLWMFPLGLMLLAVDLPALQGPLSAQMVRSRRWFERHRRRWFRS